LVGCLHALRNHKFSITLLLELCLKILTIQFNNLMHFKGFSLIFLNEFHPRLEDSLTHNHLQNRFYLQNEIKQFWFILLDLGANINPSFFRLILRGWRSVNIEISLYRGFIIRWDIRQLIIGIYKLILFILETNNVNGKQYVSRYFGFWETVYGAAAKSYSSSFCSCVAIQLCITAQLIFII